MNARTFGPWSVNNGMVQIEHEPDADCSRDFKAEAAELACLISYAPDTLRQAVLRQQFEALVMAAIEHGRELERGYP